MKKAGANWVDGNRFFDREAELRVLKERVRHGTHTLLTAQRRMGKTSLVRELLRRLAEEGRYETVFVDLEDADTAADAVVEMGLRSRRVGSVRRWIKTSFANALRDVRDKIDTLEVTEVRVKLRAATDAGNWRQRGDGVFAALASNRRPVVLAVDELPILVNRMLRDDAHRITPDGVRQADVFLSWLRRNGQVHRGRVCIILSGSVGLEPILLQAGLSAHANIFSALDLKPWDETTAMECLAALASSYDLDLPGNVRRAMCRQLRCQVPHHVQQFFDHLDEDLRMAGRREATLRDVTRVYTEAMLGVRGQADLDHYENRLKLALGSEGYETALDLLTEAAVGNGTLDDNTVRHYDERARTRALAGSVAVSDVLRILEHDGYLERRGNAYRFISGLLEDWWRARHGRHFVPVAERKGPRGSGRP